MVPVLAIVINPIFAVSVPLDSKLNDCVSIFATPAFKLPVEISSDEKELTRAVIAL
jgi:hypothetical protein